MFDIPTDLPPELVPLTWLIGTWEGEGMVEYEVDGKLRMHPFHQRVEFTHNDQPFLEYRSRSWLLPDGSSDADGTGEPGAGENSTEGAEKPFLPEGMDALMPKGPTVTPAASDELAGLLPLTSEMGFWRLARPRDAGDVGPGMLPPSDNTSYPNADAVEELRNDQNGFDLEVTLAHPTGVSELYYGMIRGPRVDLATEGVVRSSGSAEYRSATRMYGLVQGRMFWAWDIAALGGELATHASAQLTRVSE